MPSGRITKRMIDTHPGGSKLEFLWDDSLRGFGARISPAGDVSYLYQYRLGGREAPTRHCTIG